MVDYVTCDRWGNRVMRLAGSFLSLSVFILLCGASNLSASEPRATFGSEQEAESYHLIRSLEVLYASMPSAEASKDAFKADMQFLRSTALQNQTRAEYAGLDPEIAERYSDFTAYQDAYVKYLVNVGAIDADAEDFYDRLKDAVDSGVKGSVTTWNVGLAVGSVTYEPNSAALIGFAAGLTDSVSSYHKKNRERERLRDEMLRMESQKILDAYTRVTSKARQTALRLSQKYDWERGEVGWKKSDSLAEQFSTYFVNSDVEGVKRTGISIVEFRPRDAYAFISFCQLLDEYSLFGSVDELLILRDLAKQKRQYVPDAPHYDDLRLSLDYYSAAFTSYAAIEILPEQTTELDRAIAEWNALLEMSPGDSTGVIRRFLALMLAYGNQGMAALKYSDAVLPLLDEDPTFHLQRLFVLSTASTSLEASSAPATGSAMRVLQLRKKSRLLPQLMEEGYASLDKAAEAGLLNVHGLRLEPAYEFLRGPRFDKYTTIHTDWRVKEDLMKDDLILVNRSEHTLTNVQVDFHLRSDDGKSAKATVQADVIEPGQRIIWEDKIKSKWGSRWVVGRSQINLSCDQNAAYE